MLRTISFVVIFVLEIGEVASIPTQIPSGCPAQFVRLGDSCYYFAVNERLGLPNADNTCKAMRSSLTGIESHSEFHFITREIEKLNQTSGSSFMTLPAWRQQFWTSGRREELGWTWSLDSGEKYSLKTYKPLIYQDWYKDEPSEVYEQSVTAMYKRGKWGWNDFFTLDDLSFICEKEKSRNEDCPEKFREYNRSCYLFVGDNDMSQTRATLYCNGLGTHLVAIETQEEWNFIKRCIEEYVHERGDALNYEQWWTGGKQYWYLAATKNTTSKMLFHWDLTITQVPSADWYPYHPLAHPVTSYLTLFYEDNKWYWLDENRDSSLQYICESARKHHTGCKRGWFEHANSCYLIDKYNLRNRHSAEVTCMKAGGRLASVKTREELEFIISKLTTAHIPDGTKWWTGGLPVQGNWIWSDDYALFGEGTLTSAWSPGEPNDWDDNENRITLNYREGKWGLNDVPMDSRLVLPFICEIKLDDGDEKACAEIVGRKHITRLPRTGGTWAKLILNATFTCPGRVSRWRYYRSNTEFSVYGAIWRPNGDGSFMLVGEVVFPATNNGETIVEAYPIPVLPGDVLGIHYPRMAEAGVIAHAIEEDRIVDQNELSRIMVLELHQEDMAIGRSIEPSLHTISDDEQCLSIQAFVTPTD